MTMRLNFRLSCALVAAVLLAGCATPKFTNLDEYQQLTTEGTTVVQASLRALDQISANPGPSGPKTIPDFGRAVQRLQVDSIRIRARARAIRSRGDDYFASWENEMTKIKDARMRETVERSHAELQTSFSKIKAASQKAGAAFDLYLGALLKLRVDLETKSGQIDNAADRALIQTATANGQEVLRELGAINGELTSMKRLLKSRYEEAH